MKAIVPRKIIIQELPEFALTSKRKSIHDEFHAPQDIITSFFLAGGITTMVNEMIKENRGNTLATER